MIASMTSFPVIPLKMPEVTTGFQRKKKQLLRNKLPVSGQLPVKTSTLYTENWLLWLHLCTLTWGLEIQSDQLGSADPHGQRVVVGRVQPLSSRINPGKLTAVVLQEAFPSAACRKLLCLCLWEGGHVPVPRPLCPNLWKQQQVTQIRRKKSHRNCQKKQGQRSRESFVVLTVLVEGDRSAIDHEIRQLHRNLFPPLHLLLLLHLLPWRWESFILWGQVWQHLIHL